MRYAFTMTRNYYGKEQVDTTVFREAIKFYLMFIHGIRDDAYKYHNINNVLKHQHKVYIKKIMCAPDKLT